MYHDILIALEGKPTDQAPVAYATTLAQQDSATLTLLQIIAIAAFDSLNVERATKRLSRYWAVI